MRLNASSTTAYAYDALDRRISKTSGGTTTRFLHASSDEIAEYTGAGVLLRRFVPGVDADERAAFIDSGAVAPTTTAVKYPHADPQGSIMSMTDSAGAVSERFAYDGFGRANSSSSGYSFRYTGQRLDSETGLMFYKARVYSQSLGRFLQIDPIGTKDDLNLYAYVGNDPSNNTDPTGMSPKWRKVMRDMESRGDIRPGSLQQAEQFHTNFVTGVLLSGMAAGPVWIGATDAWYATGAWVALCSVACAGSASRKSTSYGSEGVGIGQISTIALGKTIGLSAFAERLGAQTYRTLG